MPVGHPRNQEPLPCGLAWHVEPEAWHLAGERLRVTAGRSTDNFIDPGGAITVLNGARAMVLAPRGPWQFTARVTPDFANTYDAGVLLVWVEDRRFAKLCFELSPRDEATIVSVVTRGVSDDANSWSAHRGSMWLRVSRLRSGAYAFHSRGATTRSWELVRYFHLHQDEPVQVGLAAQSPLGPGCTVEFTEVTFTDNELTEIRDGS